MIDIPHEVTTVLGGLNLMRVRGHMYGTEFASNTTPAGGGVLALSLSRRLPAHARLLVGDDADTEIERV